MKKIKNNEKKIEGVELKDNQLIHWAGFLRAWQHDYSLGGATARKAVKLLKDVFTLEAQAQFPDLVMDALDPLKVEPIEGGNGVRISTRKAVAK